MSATAAEAHRLSDLLGDHHDLAVLAYDAEAHADLFSQAGDLELFCDLIAERQDELAQAAFALGDRLYAEKPGAFDRRNRALWRAWRAPA